MELKIRATFMEPLLGVVPKNPSVYADWVALKQAAQADEEPPETTEERSWTGFNSYEIGLHLMDYMVKGFLKEAAINLIFKTDLVNKRGEPMSEMMLRKRIDNWVFVYPRRIYLGKTKPDGVIERPLRAKTLRGDRIALARSDYVEAGTKIDFIVEALEGCPITEKHILEWLDYGVKKGLGQFRGGSYGRFTYEVIA